MSLKVFTNLELQLRITTPFDYYPILFEKWTEFSKLKLGLDFMMQLSMTLKESASYSSEELFYGGVLAVIEYKNVRLKPEQLNNLKSLTLNWSRIESISKIILEGLKEEELHQHI